MMGAMHNSSFNLSFSPLLPSHCFVDRGLLCSERSVLFEQMLTLICLLSPTASWEPFYPFSGPSGHMIIHSVVHLLGKMLDKNNDIHILYPLPPPQKKTPISERDNLISSICMICLERCLT